MKKFFLFIYVIILFSINFTRWLTSEELQELSNKGYEVEVISEDGEETIILKKKEIVNKKEEKEEKKNCAGLLILLLIILIFAIGAA